MAECSCKLLKMQFLIPIIQDLLLVSGVVGFMFYRINFKLNYSDYTFNYDIDFEYPLNNWLKETVVFHFA